MPTFSRIATVLSPFLFRALRGGRRARAVLVALVLTALSVVSGVQVATGEDAFEREVRVLLGLESPPWEREYREVVRFAFSDDDFEYQREIRRRALAVLEDPTLPVDLEVKTFLLSAMTDAMLLYRAAEDRIPDAVSGDERVRYAALQAQARALWPRMDSVLATLDDVPITTVGGDVWRDEAERARLERLLAAGGLPAVERYRSPLGTRDAAGLVGLAAGFFLFAAAAVVVPFGAGSVLAHEVHGGTLAPLLGTGLSTGEVVAGLFAGSAARIAIVVSPLALLFFGATVVAGDPVAGVAALVTLVAVTGFLSALAMALGHALGKRLMPLATSGLLLAVLLPGAMVGWFAGLFAAGGAPESGMAVGLYPQLALGHVLREAVLPTAEVEAAARMGLSASLAVNVLASAVFGLLAVRALTRLVAGRGGPALGRVEAAVGYATALAAAVLALGVIPEAVDPGPFALDWDAPRIVALLAFFAAVPVLALLAAARTDLARARRGVLRPLLPELAVAIGVGVAFVAVASPGRFGDVRLATAASVLARTVWVAGVYALAALVLTVRPPRFGGAVLLGLGLLGAFFVGAEAIGIATAPPGETAANLLLPLADASPLLVAFEILLLVGLPAACVYRLRARPGPLDVDVDGDAGA